MKKHIIFTCLVLIILFFSGCNSPESTENTSDHDLVIYTSIYPIQYVAEQIAGNTAVVESIYPPGVDAHTYEPTSKEITKIATADAFIYLGAGMEGFAETTAAALKSQDLTFIEIGEHEELFTENEEDDDHHHDHEGHDHGDMDPHIWLDPLRMVEMGEIIKSELNNLAPEHQEQFDENFSRFKENMVVLDDNYKSALETKSNKHIIVSHAAYGYWEERYGIKQIPVNGLSSGDEPSQKDLIAITELAKEKNLKYVIFEQNSSNRISTIIQDHINAKALEIHNLEVLTEDDIKNKEDYLSLMQKNLEVLDIATQ